MNPLEIFLLLAGLGILLGAALWAWAVSHLIDRAVESYSHGKKSVPNDFRGDETTVP